MARLVTKFKYPRPSAKQNIGGYARYIATREGVEKIDDTYKLSSVSGKTFPTRKICMSMRTT